MQIEAGLVDNMVLQQATGNGAIASLSGTAGLSGPVLLRIKRGKTGRWSRARRVGVARKGRFAATLPGLPSGGPYAVELSVRHASSEESVVVQDVLVGEVWVVAGQSNICGGGPAGAEIESHPHVRAFHLNDQWRVAKDPIWHAYHCVDSIHPTLYGGQPDNEASPSPPGAAIVFALTRFKETGIPIGLIASAHPGSSMAQWSPSLKHMGGASLYGAMLRRIRKNGGRIGGLLWYQGESETGPETSLAYPTVMEHFFAAVRDEVGDPSLPIVMAQIGRVVGPEFSDLCWTRVRDAQRLLSHRLSNLTLVPTIDLPLGDLIHLNGHAQQALGHRFASAYSGSRPSITVRAVTFSVPYLTAEIRVEFENVVGRLMAQGRPSGFSVRDQEGNERAYAIELEGTVAIIKTTLDGTAVKAAALYYGYGRDPYCNITDARARPVPAFGPISIPGPRVITTFVTVLRVSAVLPLPELGFARMPYRSPQDLDMGVRMFDGTFCNVHRDIQMSGTDGVIFLACDIRCRTAMNLVFLLGYDGPLRVWLDGKAVFLDLNGQCPARPDTASFPLKVRPGRHGMVIALAANQGAAWGVYLRVERTDRQGLASGVMPEILG